MTFPGFPRRLTTECYLRDDWVDVSGDVYTETDYLGTRGQGDEANVVAPSSLSFALRNNDGNYTPDNPEGIHYGTFGRNTPIRNSIGIITDPFSRTLTTGWGGVDAGHSYSLAGAGGTILASDYAVSGGSGLVTVPVANAYRMAYLPSISHRNIEISVLCWTPPQDVTGASAHPGNIVLRGQSLTDYYLVRVSITTTETVTISIEHYDGTVVAPAVTVPEITDPFGGYMLWVRAVTEGDSIRAKVWQYGSGEPHDWQVSGESTRIRTAGWVGVRCGLASGNTNAPLTYHFVGSLAPITVRQPRFAGEISSIEHSWDLSGQRVQAAIRASGPLRRLGQGSSPLRSAVYRAVTADDLVAYWPMEDPRGSTGVASAVIDGIPMVVHHGTADFAADDSFSSSSALPAFNGTTLVGQLSSYDQTANVLQFTFLLRYSPTASPNTVLLNLKSTGGSVQRAETTLYTGNPPLVTTVLYSVTGSSLGSAGLNLPTQSDPVKTMMSIRFEQIGTTVRVTSSVFAADLDPSEAEQLTGFTDFASQSIGRFTQVTVNPGRSIRNDIVVGHLEVTARAILLSTRISVLNAHHGESAGRRLQRLCTEEGITFSFRGDLDTTAPMGYQRPATLVELLTECADVDLGTLYETRSVHGMGYRTRTDHYNQTPLVTLAYGNGVVGAPLESADDDQKIRNDVTVSRTGGSAWRARQVTGPLAVIDPQDGGVGVYDTSVSVTAAGDTQLYDIAGWLLYRGTIDKTRYPTITVDLLHPRYTDDPALSAAILDYDGGDVVAVTGRLPNGSPGPIVQSIRGFGERANLDRHVMSFTGSPATVFDVLQLDIPGHKIDSSSSTLTGGPYSETASSLSVASTAELWTTDPADMPISVLVSGEEFSVTSISGASSPQTFTVTRSVNRIRKIQVAGTPVALTRRATISL